MVAKDPSASPFGTPAAAGPWNPGLPGRLRGVKDYRFELWMAVIFLAVTDLGLTVLGLQYGFVEVNPFAQHGLAVWGLWALFAGKAFAIVIGALSARTLERYRFMVPMIFVVIWGVVVASNAHLLMTSI